MGVVIYHKVIIFHLIGQYCDWCEKRRKEKRKINCLTCRLNIMSRRDLSLEEKINLIKEKESGLSHRQLSERFQVSVGAVSNILKRKAEYTDDYELNRNKKIKRKLKDDVSQAYDAL